MSISPALKRALAHADSSGTMEMAVEQMKENGQVATVSFQAESNIGAPSDSQVSPLRFTKANSTWPTQR